MGDPTVLGAAGGQTAAMIVDSAVYRDGVRLEIPPSIADCAKQCHAKSFMWVGLHDPTDDEIEEVTRECGLHELLVEDVSKAHQRTKLDVFDEATLVVFKTAKYNQPDKVEIGELQVIIGPDFVITVRHGAASALGSVRRRLERDPDFLRFGPMAVVYGIADEVVDDYAPVLSELEIDIDEAEADVFSNQRVSQAARIYRLKRQVLELSRNVMPVSDVVGGLCSTEARLVPPDLRDYFGDVADHAHRIIDRIHVASELLSDALNANLAQVSVQQNDDMRRISAWAAMIAAPTLLAGIWGMNFEHMPELEWYLGYPLALGLMGVVVVILWRSFRRAGWI